MDPNTIVDLSQYPDSPDEYDPEEFPSPPIAMWKRNRSSGSNAKENVSGGSSGQSSFKRKTPFISRKKILLDKVSSEMMEKILDENRRLMNRSNLVPATFSSR